MLNRSIALKLLTLCSACVFMQSCSLLSPVKPLEPNRYLLDSHASHAKYHARLKRTLMVQPIDTVAVFNTTQMAYSVHPYQIGYYAHNEWAETPAQMLEPLIIGSLEDSGHFKAVIGPGNASRYQYALYLQILDLKFNFNSRPAQAELRLRAQLNRYAANQVIATAEFTAIQPLRCPTPYGGVYAMNQALSRVLAQLTEFCSKIR